MTRRDRADAASDEIEARTAKRVEDIYSSALVTALKRINADVEKLKEIGADEKDEKKREVKLRNAIRQSGMANVIAREIARAGVMAAGAIQSAMEEIDAVNREVDAIGVQENGASAL